MSEISRRRFLVRTAGVGGVVTVSGGLSALLAACTPGAGSSPSATGAPATGAPATSGPTAVPSVAIVTPKLAVTSNLGASYATRDAGPLLYGKEFGLEMTSDDIIKFDSHAVATQTVLAGQADVVAGSLVSHMAVAKQGQPFKIFSPFVNSDDFVLAGKAGSSFDGIVDGSLSIGVDSPGGAASVILQAILEANNVEASVPDLPNAKILESSGQRTTALAAGEIDTSVIHIYQFTAAKVERPDLEIIATLYEDVPLFVKEAYAAPAEWLDANIPTATAIVQSIMAASRAFEADFAAYQEAVKELIAEPPPDDVLQVVWDLAVQYKFWPANGDITKEGYDFMAGLAVRQGLFDTPPSYEDVVDRRAMDAAIASF